jgi:hypothetical protein
MMKRIAALIVACVLAATITGCDDTTSDKIHAPLNASDVSNSKYQDVVSQFKKSGFTNVTTKEIDDLIIGFLTEDGEVEKVSIGGDTSFSTSDAFAADTPVVVSFHTFPKQDSEAANPSSSAAEGPSNSPAPNTQNITVDNNEEFRALIESPQPDNATIEQFVSKYKGRTIEFDGNVAYVAPYKSYKTRFEFLICPGDYSTTSAHGPSFKFSDVAYHDLHLTGANIPDSIGTGQNLHIVAEILEYNSVQQLFYLKPVATSAR